MTLVSEALLFGEDENVHIANPEKRQRTGVCSSCESV